MISADADIEGLRRRLAALQSRLARLRAAPADVLTDAGVIALAAPVLDQLQVGVIIMDSSRRVLLINAAMSRLWRGSLGPGEVIDVPSYRGWDARTGASLAGEDWPILKALSAGVAQDAVEIRMERRDGSTGHMMLSAMPVLGPDGRVIAGVAVAQDISELRATQRRAALDEDLLRRIGATTPDLIYAKDRQGRMIFANPAVLAAAGRSWAQVGGRTDLDWHDHPEEAKRFVEDDERVMASGLTQTFEETLTGPAGPQTFQSSKTPMRDAEGNVIGLFGISTDITSRKTAEAQLRAQAEALLRAQESLAAIFDASSEGLTLCRLIRDEAGTVTDYQVVDANPAHGRLTGATRAQMLEQPLSRIAPPVRPIWFHSAERAVATGEMQTFEVRSTATPFWLDIHVAPVAGDLFVQTFIDVTSRRDIEEQRQRFLAEMNHRVKNNFQMVASVLNIQARRTTNSEVRDHLTTAQQRIQLLARLHDSLSLAPGAGEVDFSDYLLSLCEKLRGLIDEPERIRLEAESVPARLLSDTAMALGFIVNELVTNAVKYAFPPPAAGRIAVSFEAWGDGWRLMVADDGAGMDESAGAKTKGLGRRLVAAFADQIGASLEVTRSPGVVYTILAPGSGAARPGVGLQ